MRSPLTSVVLVFLAACSITEEEFRAQNEENFCAALQDCGALETCDDGTTSGSTSSTESTSACEFDAAQAQACLDATWSCADSFPVAPAECDTVYVCATGTDETAS